MRRRDLLTGAFAQPSASGMLTELLRAKYVQAQLYRAGNGAGLLSGAEAGYLAQIGEHKQAHVAALAQALAAPPLNATPPAPVALRFDAALASRQTYLDTAYAIEDVLVRLYIGMPPTAIAETIAVRFQLPGLVSADARALAVLGTLTGRPVVGGVLAAADVRPATAAEVTAVLLPFLADPASAAGTAGVTE